MDSHRLDPARLVLVVDADDVAGFQHLGGGFGHPGFVAVQRRQGQRAGQAGDQRDQGRERPSAPASRHPIQASLLRHRAGDTTKSPPVRTPSAALRPAPDVG